jgi:hypothetical protein
VLDQIGVGRIIQHACQHARDTKADIKIGVCGEQAGDPESAKFLVACGVDYVSCSPYRVPIARLAVAQALLETDRVHIDVLNAIAHREATTLAEEVLAESPTVEAVVSLVDASAEFVVLHSLRIKGFANSGVVAEIACIDPDVVDRMLPDMAASGLCRHIAARDLWQLTPEGRERHAELLLKESGSEVDGLRPHYERFLELNDGFKTLCSNWQTRDGDANDHSDAAYDGGRIAELRQLHEASAPVIEGFAGAVPRFESYFRRLTGSLTRLEGGETRMFTGVMCGSYHDVWMELHEDLVQLLGVDRHAEGSY